MQACDCDLAIRIAYGDDLVCESIKAKDGSQTVVIYSRQPQFVVAFSDLGCHDVFRGSSAMLSKYRSKTCACFFCAGNQSGSWRKVWKNARLEEEDVIWKGTGRNVLGMGCGDI